MTQKVARNVDIVVLAHDEGAYLELDGAIKQWCAGDEITLRLREVRLPVASVDSFLGEGRPYIFVLALDVATMRANDVSEMLDALFEHIASHPEILFLPWLRGTTYEHVQRDANANYDVAVSVIENVHLDPSLETLEGVTNAINRHLKLYWLIEENTYFHGWVKRASVGFGYLAWGAVLGLSGLAQLIWHVSVKPDSIWARTVTWPEALSVMGVSAFAAVLYELTWRTTCSVVGLFSGRTHRFVPAIAQGVAVGVLWRLLGRITGVLDVVRHWDSMALGLGIGAVLISAIRAGRRGKMNMDFGRIPQLLTMDEAVPHFYIWALKKFVLTAKRTMPVSHESFFVSYSRSSPWCVETAEAVTKGLSALNTPVFLDRKSLQPGECWKSRLQASLDEIDVFVMAIDSEACKKKWVVSEFMTACMGRAMKLSPKIIILHPPEFNPLEADGSRYARVFSGILQQIKARGMWWLTPCFMPYTGTHLERTCSAMRFQANRWWTAEMVLSVLGIVMLMMFQIVGPVLLLTVGLLQCRFSPNEIAGFVRSYPLAMRFVTIFAGGIMGFGVPWTIFRMSRKTRMAGIVALGGYALLFSCAVRAANYMTLVASVLIFYLGCAIGGMLAREWSKRNYAIR